MAQDDLQMTHEGGVIRFNDSEGDAYTIRTGSSSTSDEILKFEYNDRQFLWLSRSNADELCRVLRRWADTGALSLKNSFERAGEYRSAQLEGHSIKTKSTFDGRGRLIFGPVIHEAKPDQSMDPGHGKFVYWRVIEHDSVYYAVINGHHTMLSDVISSAGYAGTCWEAVFRAKIERIWSHNKPLVAIFYHDGTPGNCCFNQWMFETTCSSESIQCEFSDEAYHAIEPKPIFVRFMKEGQ